MKKKTFATHAGLVLLSVIAGGFPAAADAPKSAVPFRQALREAETIVQTRSDWEVMQGAGQSMLPFYGEHSLLFVARADISQVRPGMIVVYRDAEGDRVGHRAEEAGPGGVRVRGLRNAGRTSALVTSDNLIGVVFGVVHTRAADPASNLPRVIGKGNG